jgi:hypothetical protein
MKKLFVHLKFATVFKKNCKRPIHYNNNTLFIYRGTKDDNATQASGGGKDGNVILWERT